MKRLEWNALGEDERRAALARPAQSREAALVDTVASVIARVRADGDRALFELTRLYDEAELAELAVGAAELGAAKQALAPDLADAIEEARERIALFHRRRAARICDGHRRGCALRAGVADRSAASAVRAGRFRAAAFDRADARRARAARRVAGTPCCARHRDPTAASIRRSCSRRSAAASSACSSSAAPGRRRHGVRQRERAPLRQDLRPRQRLGHRGEATGGAGSRRRRDRPAGRAVRTAGDRRCLGRPALRGGRPALAG
jgi:hypothetical protein